MEDITWFSSADVVNSYYMASILEDIRKSLLSIFKEDKSAYSLTLDIYILLFPSL